MNDFDLKSALLIALHASALTSLTSVTTRENRSKLHSPLAAPEVVLLQWKCHYAEVDCIMQLLIEGELGWKMSDGRRKMYFVHTYVVSVPSYISHVPSQPEPEGNHSVL